jgi:hypothetical protein
MAIVRFTKTVVLGARCTDVDAVFNRELARFNRMSSGFGIQPGGCVNAAGSNMAVTVAGVVVSVTEPLPLELSCKPSPGTAVNA